MLAAFCREFERVLYPGNMPRTNTADLSSFTRQGVIYAFEAPWTVTTITLPVDSSWTSGLHWHEVHTEYLQVVSGRVRVTLGDSTRVVTPADGAQRVDRFVQHEWRRAEADGEEVVVREWTDPADGQKEVFFRNLSSAILDASETEAPDWRITLQLFMIFRELDNFPVFVGGLFRRWITRAILLGATFVGRAMGMAPVYDEYTPARLSAWRGRYRQKQHID